MYVISIYHSLHFLWLATRKGRPLSEAQHWFNRLAAKHMPDLGAFVSVNLIKFNESCAFIQIFMQISWSFMISWSVSWFGYCSGYLYWVSVDSAFRGFSFAPGLEGFLKPQSGCAACAKVGSIWTQGISAFHVGPHKYIQDYTSILMCMYVCNVL